MIRILAAALLSTATIASAASGDLHKVATKITDTHRDAVVWLSVVAKTTMSVDGDAPAQLKAQLAGQEQENTVETTGTFITPDGMLVAALARLDQSAMLDGKTVNTPMGPIKLKAESQIKDIKVIMPDGTEIPADLVLKDADLGLAFIKLRMESDEAQGVEIHAIDLADSAKGALLDDCIAIGRLGKSLNREPSVLTSEISGITTRPRTFYRVMTGSVGCPVFLANGKLLGLSVIRKPSGDLGGGKINVSPVVLPAADIAKIAEQAKSAEPVKPKTDDEPAETPEKS